jgi:hypothetical protein
MAKVIGDDGTRTTVIVLPFSFGVWGDSASGDGVVGTSVNRTGVEGNSTNGTGVVGGSDKAGSKPLDAPPQKGGSGVHGSNNLAVGIGVSGQANGESGTGVIGEADGQDGVGVSGTGGAYGVFGSSNTGFGVYGVNTNTTRIGDRPGVLGTGTEEDGVWAVSANANGLYAKGGNYAAWLDGKVFIKGPLEKPGGSFKIDHPLDPASKYLHHSFVESPDMKNIYDGVAVVDTNGEAEVELPDWFDALNNDFRYQLTPIGRGNHHQSFQDCWRYARYEGLLAGDGHP